MGINLPKDLSKKSLVGAFFFGLLGALFHPSTFPFSHINYFIPFIIISFYQKNFLQCLWIALISGVIIDLLATHLPFGITALNYCVATLILFPRKQHFFADSILTLPTMGFMFSFVATLNLFFLHQLFLNPFSMRVVWIGTDLILYPIIDAFLAFFCFTLPSLLHQPKRKGDDYFSY